jgi:hypothetical protein
MTKQLYGWYSEKARQELGDNIIATYRSADGTKNVVCTMVNESSTNPGDYCWSDAVCVGAIGKCIKMAEIQTRCSPNVRKPIVFGENGLGLIHNLVLEEEISQWDCPNSKEEKS